MSVQPPPPALTISPPNKPTKNEIQQQTKSFPLALLFLPVIGRCLDDSVPPRCLGHAALGHAAFSRSLAKSGRRVLFANSVDSKYSGSDYSISKVALRFESLLFQIATYFQPALLSTETLGAVLGARSCTECEVRCEVCARP